MMTMTPPCKDITVSPLWLIAGGQPATPPQEAGERARPRRTAQQREEMILRYTSLVRHVVARLGMPPTALLDQDDLLGYGMLGLIDAVDRFDVGRGVKFETYAIPRIHGYIVDRLRELDPLSRSSRRRARDVEQMAQLLEQDAGRPAGVAEVAARLGLEPSAVRQALADAALAVLSLDAQSFSGEDGSHTSRLDLLVDDSSLSPLVAAETRDVIAAMAILSEREREIIRLHYMEDLTMKQVSHLLGVSESRICQLHSRALERLHAHMQGAAIDHAA